MTAVLPSSLTIYPPPMNCLCIPYGTSSRCAGESEPSVVFMMCLPLYLAADRPGVGGIGADVKARVRAARPQPGSAIGSGVGPKPAKSKAAPIVTAPTSPARSKAAPTVTAPTVTASTSPAEHEAVPVPKGSEVPSHCLHLIILFILVVPCNASCCCMTEGSFSKQVIAVPSNPHCHTCLPPAES